MARLNVNLLSGIQATLDGQPVTGFESAHVRALLAYLLVENAQPHSRQQLTGLLWPEQEEARAHQRLSQALYNLRLVLGEQRRTGDLAKPGKSGSNLPFLLVFQDTVQFNPQSDYWLDIHAFTEFLQSEKGHTHKMKEACPECAERLAEAVSLYHGDFLEGFSLHGAHAFEDWALVWRERLRLQAIAALNILTQYHDGRAEIEPALNYARQQVTMDPMGDSGYRQLMRLLAVNGETTAALVLYNNFHRLLRKEMRIAPEHATQALYDRLHLEAEAGVTVGNLPVPITPLIGRRKELAELLGMLRDPACRLINLLGPGGSGKSRLALEAGNAVRYHFADGVFLASLSALESTQSILPIVAEALGFRFREQGKPHQQLQDYLHQKNILLVMDGFEAILPSAIWLSEILQVAPQVKFIVTSRARLNIKDEQIFPLKGMDYPPSNEAGDVSRYDAIQLFEQSARRVKPDFTLQIKSIPDVIKICQQVQGMPLGILLASAWMELYTPEEIAAEISKSLDFLSSTWSDVPERQRSLQATFDYSWHLLSEEERRCLTTLSIFLGSFSMLAARSVSSAPVRFLQSLIDKCLVSHTPDGRFQIHDLVHQFASERLELDPEEAKEIHTRHSRFYLNALTKWGKELKSAQQRAALEAMELDVENLRMAWRWAVETHDWQSLSDSLEGMGWYADLRFRFQEGERACRMAREELGRLSANIPLELRLLTWQSRFLNKLGQQEALQQLLISGAQLLEKGENQGLDMRREKAGWLFEQAEAAYYTDRTAASHFYRESLELYQALQSQWEVGSALLSLGELVHHSGNFIEAREILSRALDFMRSAGEPGRIARALRWQAFNEVRLGQIAQAEHILRESVELRRSSGSRLDVALANDDLGTMVTWSGKFKEGAELMKQSLVVYQELGYQLKEIWAHGVLGLQYLFLGRYKDAQAYGELCLRMADQLGDVRENALGHYIIGAAALGKSDYQAAIAFLEKSLGLYRQIDQKDELAWGLIATAGAMRWLKQVGKAREYLYEVGRIVIATHGFSAATFFIPTAALFVADRGDIKLALELYTMVNRFPHVSNSPWFNDIAWKHLELLFAELPEADAEAARANGMQRNLFATVEELIGEFSPSS